MAPDTITAQVPLCLHTVCPWVIIAASPPNRKVVTIPLSEFPLTGIYHEVDTFTRMIQKALNQQISNSTDQFYQCRFDWNKVIEFTVEHTANDDPNLEIEISNVDSILPEYKLKTVVREKEAMQD